MNSLTKSFFKSLSENSKALIEKIDPLQLINNIPKDCNVIDYKTTASKRFTLSQCFNREIQFEINNSDGLISSRINNEIILSKYKYTQNSKEMLLHKRVNDYYIIIQFRRIIPAKDKKLHAELKNEMLESNKLLARRNSFSIYKIMGMDSNQDYLQNEEESMGKEYLDKKYTDNRKIEFRINVFNKDGSGLRMYCHNVENEVRYYKLDHY
jgi:hypothetical protein